MKIPTLSIAPFLFVPISAWAEVGSGDSLDFPLELGSARSVEAVTTGEFPVDVRNKGGVGSTGSAEFVLDTTATADGWLELSVPVNVASGSVSPVLVTWHYGSNSSRTVTNLAGWKFLTNPAGSSYFSGGELHAGQVSVPTSMTVAAVYETIGGISRQSAPVTITVLPAPQARMVAGQPQAGSGVVNYSVETEGTVGTVTILWDTDGDGQFDDGSGSTLSHSYGTQTGRVGVTVKITDSAGTNWTEEIMATLNKPPVVNQPVVDKPCVDPVAISLFLPNGTYDAKGEMLTSPTPFVFNADSKNRRDSGLAVIVHGLWSDAKNEWLTRMGKNIESRCEAESITPPDIVLMDWSFDSNNPAPDGPKLLGLSNPVANAASDIAAVKHKAYVDSQYLANWIYDNSRAENSAQIDVNRPIHLIGHSAGGFVVGQAATLLKNRSGVTPIYVDRVTMLDTPRPYISHLAVGTGNFPNPGRVDRYSSTVIGNTNEFGAPEPHAWYQWFNVFKSNWEARAFLVEGGHSYAHEWYTDQTIIPAPMGAMEIHGFWFSPIINASTRIPKPYTPPQPVPLPGDGPQPAPIPPLYPDIALTGWQTFGNASENSGTWTLTESDDAGIWKDLSLPATAATLAFEFHFLNAGDGDFLAVHFGDLPTLYQGLDLPLSRDGWLPAEIPLDLLPALDGKLVITLVSRGGVNAQVQIRNIRIIQSEDADGDGLAFSAETSAGSDPRIADSDGDGLSDGVEVLQYNTDPLYADSDGDGQNDPAELAAGTNPLQNGSYLRVAAVSKTAQGFTLHWTGVSGKSYRVLRSQELGTANHETLAFGVPGSLPFTGFTDPSPPPNKAFYWVEVE